MSNPKDCKYCRTTANGDDEPCTSLLAAHECPWMSTSDWKALENRAAPAQGEPVAIHSSDCAIYNAPALPVGPCDCNCEGLKPVDQSTVGFDSRSSLQAISPADLAEVLENVRAGIAWIKTQRTHVPHELHKACYALTHMTKDSR